MIYVNKSTTIFLTTWQTGIFNHFEYKYILYILIIHVQQSLMIHKPHTVKCILGIFIEQRESLSIRKEYGYKYIGD